MAQDTEITLGTGKMLALFFGLVILCAVFFGMGFSLGKSSVKVLNATDTAPAQVSPGVVRPSAVKPVSAPAASTLQLDKSATGSSTATTDNTGTPALPPAEDSKPPEPTTAPATGGYYVQVAAVSKQEDGQALVDALKQKQYPAFAANNSSSDKLFHVQVGPFADIKEAEAMKAKLVADGYNPILKK